ncbi:MAG: DUF2484 family protein [Pseudooceanicola sp.]
MSPVLILGCLWVLAAVVVAMLPMQLQIVPGVALLIAAPVLIGAIFWLHGWLWGGFAVFAFASMMRNPLRYFWSRLNGGPVWLPEDME